jgi:hypothetical protein
MAEYAQIHDACCRLRLAYRVFAGNDQIAEFPHLIDHGVTLHPDKLSMWMSARRSKGWAIPERIWAHRAYPNVTDWTRDWDGSTGLFAVKVARELGFVHIVLCGVPMTTDAGHFLQRKPWADCGNFTRAWMERQQALKAYVRSYSGLTQELFTAPTDEWLSSPIQDVNRYPAPPQGLKA